MKFRRIAVLAVLVTALSACVSTSRPSGGEVRPGPAAPPPVVPAAASKADVATVRATQEAVRTGRRVEIADRRDAYTETYANPSGTTTVEQHLVPVRTRRDGAWVPIDKTLRAGRSGVRPVATTVDVTLSAGGRGPVTRLRHRGVDYRLTWGAPLPRPVLAGDTATYREVLPGVDLRIRVTDNGFEKVFVVKSRQAAKNPRLSALGFRVAVTGGSVRTRPGGGLNVLNKAKEVVFATDRPRMWDEPQPPPGLAGADRADHLPRHQATMPITLKSGVLTFRPDRKLLADPATVYPVYIDPSSFGLQHYDYTNVNSANRNTSYWDNWREHLRAGYSNWPGSVIVAPWRSFMNFHTWHFFGKQILRARVSINLDHSASCNDTPVELWQTRTVTRDAPATWNNTENGWQNHVADAWGHGNEDDGCASTQPDMTMSFDSDPNWPALRTVVQQAADGAYGYFMSFGLKAPNEGDKFQWKRFTPWSAVLTVEYNTPPTRPADLSTVPASVCGGAETPTRLGATFLTPSFSAHLRDDDANLVSGEMQIRDNAGTVAHTGRTSRVANASVAVWQPVPADVLRPDTVYSYRARTDDGSSTGEWTTPCWFIVDSVGPRAPTVLTDDFPDWTPVRGVGQLGSITFHKNGADTDIAGYYYGFSRDRMTGWTPAAAEGRNAQDDTTAGSGDATIPMTLWRDPATGRPETDLFVQAEDLSGNRSPVVGPFHLEAGDTGATPPRVRNDVNGDGKGDVTALFDSGDDRLRAWAVTSSGDGFRTSHVGWDTGRDGSSYVTMRSVSGDFTGDGLTDLALFRQDPDGRTRLFLLRSNGHSFATMGDPVWTSPADPAWALANLKIAAGNLDGAGADDLVAGAKGNGTAWKAYVWTAATGHATPQTWRDDAGTGAAWTDLRFLVGDVDADGDGDLLVASGAGSLTLHRYPSGRTAFGAGVQAFSSTAYDLARVQLATGNFDGDTTNTTGRDDVVALVDDGRDSSGSHARLIRLTSNGATFTDSRAWPAAGEPAVFDARTASLTATDLNADGRTDLAVFTDCCAPGNKELWSFTATETGFADQNRALEIHVSDRPNAEGHWSFDEAAPLKADRFGNHPMTAAGAPGQRAGHRGYNGDNALQLTGNQYAATPGPVVRTDRSYTVSAWAFLDAPTGPNWRPVVSADGRNVSAFILRASGNNKWAFSVASTDGPHDTFLDVESRSQVTLEKWTHLAGVYDAAAAEVRLYVNGVLEASAPFTGGFHAYGPLVAGRDRTNGATFRSWIGGIDEVQIHNQAKTNHDIYRMTERPPTSHWRLSTGADGNVDSTGSAHLAVHGPPDGSTDRAGNAGGALRFDGSGRQYAVTDTPAVTGDDNFTVSAWLKLDALGGGGNYRGAVSQDGVHNSKFFLRYNGTDNRWVFAVSHEDRVGSAHTNLSAGVAPVAGRWTLVTGVYHRTSRTMKIYVDGELSGEAVIPGTFASTGVVNIGRDRYNDEVHSTWTGHIDDVRIYHTALTDTEVRLLLAKTP